ncbi:hypothetical protein NFI95_15860 [Acetobacteraceae bacterium KSS8]|uniref:Twin-arginine translocation signal domain-containing protein n=1 Tax=Endosaccharibacter trunci TaxID=2812733 RepID=A0ABT1WDN1_9PROT|nr:hypothetical protein [Acetobacteraceae bacterium KSS8]
MSSVTRRALIEIAGFTGLAGIAAATVAGPERLEGATHPMSADFALVALASKHKQAQQSLATLIRESSERYGADLPQEVWDQQRDAIDRTNEIEDSMALLSASILKGLCAKAQVIRAQLGYMGDPDEEHALLWSLCADLQRLDSALHPNDRVPS